MTAKDNHIHYDIAWVVDTEIDNSVNAVIESAAYDKIVAIIDVNIDDMIDDPLYWSMYDLFQMQRMR